VNLRIVVLELSVHAELIAGSRERQNKRHARFMRLPKNKMHFLKEFGRAVVRKRITFNKFLLFETFNPT
jgi:hypothetical protein